MITGPVARDGSPHPAARQPEDAFHRGGRQTNNLDIYKINNIVDISGV